MKDPTILSLLQALSRGTLLALQLAPLLQLNAHSPVSMEYALLVFQLQHVSVTVATLDLTAVLVSILWNFVFMIININQNLYTEKAIFPDLCHLVSVFPLTTDFLSNYGRAMDLTSASRSASLPTGSAVDWSTNVPYSTNPPVMAIANLAYSSAGSVKVNYGYLKPAFQSASSFTISCWFRFALTAYYTRLYPVFSFTNLWTASSPLLYISPDSKMKFVYKYGTTKYEIDDTLSEVIGIGPWVYISVQFDAASNKLKLQMTSDFYTNTYHEWSLAVIPMFGAAELWIGSTDMSLAGTDTVFNGQIACLSLYATALDTTRIDQVKDACDSLLNGPGLSTIVDHYSSLVLIFLK